jgi:hypothetical protein
VVTSQVAHAGPEADPQGGVHSVEYHKSPPRHVGDTGDDAVGLAQPFDESARSDHLAAMPGEKPLRPLKLLGW